MEHLRPPVDRNHSVQQEQRGILLLIFKIQFVFELNPARRRRILPAFSLSMAENPIPTMVPSLFPIPSRSSSKRVPYRKPRLPCEVRSRSELQKILETVGRCLWVPLSLQNSAILNGRQHSNYAAKTHIICEIGNCFNAVHMPQTVQVMLAWLVTRNLDAVTTLCEHKGPRYRCAHRVSTHAKSGTHGQNSVVAATQQNQLRSRYDMLTNICGNIARIKLGIQKVEVWRFL